MFIFLIAKASHSHRSHILFPSRRSHSRIIQYQFAKNIFIVYCYCLTISANQSRPQKEISRVFFGYLKKKKFEEELKRAIRSISWQLFSFFLMLRSSKNSSKSCARNQDIRELQFNCLRFFFSSAFRRHFVSAFLPLTRSRFTVRSIWNDVLCCGRVSWRMKIYE
jgi:hypothetical protein